MFKSYCAAAVAAVLFSACTPSSKQTTNPTPESVSKQTAVATASSESQRVNAFFERVFEESVARYPEYLTSLGRKERADEWNDLSEAYANESMQLTKQQLVELKAFDRNKLDPGTVLSYDLLVQSMENDIADNKWRLYNYPINQMFGRHSGVVSLLINQHSINSVQDAENYITRLEGVPKLFKQLITNIEARTAANIIPPKFVFPHVIRDSNNIIKGAPFDDGEPSALLADLTKKLQTLSEKEGSQLTDENKTRLLDAAILALNTAVKPAYEKLVAHLTELETKATTDDGVWKWKNGETFYNVALKRTTTTDLTAAQIHEIGLKEVARIHDEMRVIKDKVNFEGDLQAFMQFMRDDDQFYYPNTDEGKARYLREATALIDDMKLKLDGMFITQPKADLNVKAVEAFREQSAGKAFYQRPSEDGTRPGLYYANLYDMKAMPTYQMEALAYHEGIPGHHMQLAIQQELQDVPKFRKFGGYTAYIEGWGLYSEYLPKEFGAYQDPYSDFGRLAMELWRACRLVVDTGIHAKKWTREQGIAYYTENTPNAVSDGVKMVERHIVMPSQATAYKIGMLKILELRTMAKTKLGDKFDIREYHDEILKYGPLPLNIVETKVNDWIATKLAI
ncbi:lipoprotein [Paraglaciecola psychrophila 170]|uniref:Lipoprotein n=1 Tax=Paraglaciecola psychrophila 170 TaxID=1129794 RepID=K7AY76_9ALTE|nr:lipoprotein [Paraglaciecola psychrophila 170]GAC40055.1 lipoprotein [Paraglaciecola psychrophila 170]